MGGSPRARDPEVFGLEVARLEVPDPKVRRFSGQRSEGPWAGGVEVLGLEVLESLRPGGPRVGGSKILRLKVLGS